MAVTMKDIAKKTGFSASTVSYVLSGSRTDIKISAETRSKVMEAAGQLNYQPNLMARSLRQQKSQAIGVAFAGHLGAMSDPVISAILSGIGTAVNDTPYSMHLFTRFDDITEVSLEAAKGKKVDGLIYFVYNRTFNTFNRVFGPELDKHKIPYMGIQFFSHYDNPRVVRIDLEKGSCLAVAHLAGKGIKEVGLVIDNLKYYYSEEPARGFKKAVAEHGITKTTVHQINIYQAHKPLGVYQRGYDLARDLTDKGELLEAYYINSDIAACGFIDCLKEKGVRVPEDIAVIGFGNLSGWGREQGFLTTVDCKYSERGQEAGKQLVAMLEGKTADIPEGILLEPELIVRRSSIKPVDN